MSLAYIIWDMNVCILISENFDLLVFLEQISGFIPVGPLISEPNFMANHLILLRHFTKKQNCQPADVVTG